MGYLFGASLWLLCAGAVSASDALEASIYQTPSPEPERFDMEAAEQRWVRIGSWFLILLIVVILVKTSIGKKKPVPRGTTTRRPPSRR
jgi:hypothetical protein